MSTIIEHIDQVTPEWLTSVLSTSIDDQQNVIAIDIKPSLAPGMASDRYHLAITYDNTNQKPGPTQLFLKIGKPEVVELQQREIDFYQSVAIKNTEIPLLRCYDTGYSVDSRGSHLLFQDVSSSHHYRSGNIPPTRSECRLAIDCLGKIHAAWWNQTELIASLKTNGNSNERQLNQVLEFAPVFLDSLGDKISKRQCRNYELIISRLPEILRSRQHEPVTLVHGDSHFGNFMFANDSGENDAILLDWSAWRVGNLGSDLALMMAYSWFPQRRKELEKVLVKQYHEVLISNGVKNYNWDQCWRDYKLGVLHNFLITIFLGMAGMDFWFNNLELNFMAFDDLNCVELLK